jgi:tetratricopeptide (TPR) repeat protein
MGNNPSQALHKASALYALKRYEEALLSYDQCLEEDPNCVRAYNGKGNVLNGLTRYKEALLCFDQCLEKDPNYIRAYNGKGLALKKLHRYEEAILCHNKCLELDPNFIVILFDRVSRTLSSGFNLIVGEEDFAALVVWFMKFCSGRNRTSSRHSFVSHILLLFQRRELLSSPCDSSMRVSAVSTF